MMSTQERDAAEQILSELPVRPEPLQSKCSVVGKQQVIG